MSMARLIAGFALAPLPVLTLPGVIASDLDLLLEVMTIGYGATLIVGIPVHLILESRNRQRLSHYLAATAYAVLLASILAAACDTLLLGTGEDNRFGVTLWSMLGVFGVLMLALFACFTAATFWWIAVRKPAPFA